MAIFFAFAHLYNKRRNIKINLVQNFNPPAMFKPVCYWDETSHYKYVCLGHSSGNYYAKVLPHGVTRPIFVKMKDISDEMAQNRRNQVDIQSVHENIQMGEPVLTIGPRSRIQSLTFKHKKELSIIQSFVKRNHQIMVLKINPDSTDFIFKVCDLQRQNVLTRTCLNKANSVSNYILSLLSCCQIHYFHDNSSIRTKYDICACPKEEANTFDGGLFNASHDFSLTTRDGNSNISEQNWAVRVINSTSDDYGHAQIVIEGVNEGRYFTKVADIKAQNEIKTKLDYAKSHPAIIECRDLTSREIKYWGHTRWELAERSKIQKMLIKIAEMQSTPGITIFLPGKNCTLTGNYQNCLDWAEQMLAEASIYCLVEKTKSIVNKPSEAIPTNNPRSWENMYPIPSLSVSWGFPQYKATRCLTCRKVVSIKT